MNRSSLSSIRAVSYTHLEEGSKGASIPRMTLQPIVENSIKYGFGEDRDCLEIRIRTKIQNGILSVIIADNGVGIQPGLLKELKANLGQGQNQDRKSTRLNSSHITRSRMPSSA